MQRLSHFSPDLSILDQASNSAIDSTEPIARSEVFARGIRRHPSDSLPLEGL